MSSARRDAPRSQAYWAAARRLALLFAAIVLILMLASTALIYTSFTRDLHDFYDTRVLNEERERELVADAIADLRRQVLILDAVVFAAVGAFGLWYARRAMRPIDEALESQRRFIANASHELRTPLAIMRADLEVARGDPDDVPELLRSVDGTIEEVDRMSGIVADMLMLSRIDARVERLEPRDVDLSRLLDATIQKLRSYAERQGVRLERGGAPGDVPARVDPDRLQRALFNLLKNAVEHTPRETCVTASLATDGERARFLVADRGPGIDPAFREQVFERFHRGSGGHPGESGSGLGLPIARWIAEAHGGSLELTDGPGGGTTATLIIPLRGPSS
jgi:signal transduction histidine kinase